MSKAYVLTESHFAGNEKYTDILGIYTNANNAYEDAHKRAVEKFTTFVPKPGEFIWTANVDFDLDDLVDCGIMYMSIGSEKTDSIIEYFTLDIKEGVIKE